MLTVDGDLICGLIHYAGEAWVVCYSEKPHCHYAVKGSEIRPLCS